MRLAFTRGAALLAGLVLAAPARAQLIDLYLPNDLSRRYAIEALPEAAPLRPEDLPVAQRLPLRPELQPLGVRLGSFLLRPELAESLGYDSAPLPGTAARGAPLVRTEASAELTSQWSRHALGGRLSLDDRRYIEHDRDFPDPSRTDWSGTLWGTREIGRDALSLSAAHLSLSETQEAVDAALASAPLRYDVEDLRLSYRAVFGRASLTPEIGFRRYRFERGEDPIAGDQSFRDRDVWEAGLTGRYGLAPARDLVLVLRGGRSEFRRQEPGLIEQDSSTVALLAGLDDSSGGVFRYRLLAGWQMRDYDAPGVSTRQAPVVEAGLTWLATGLTTVSGTLSRRIEDSSAEGLTGFTLTTGRLRLDHELRRNILLDISLGLERADFSRGGGRTTLASAGAGASWRMNRHAALSLDYRFTDRDATRGTSYSGSTLLLRLALAL